nr:polyprotein [Alphaendornavirus sp.]
MDQQAKQNKNNTHTHNRGSKEESTVTRWTNPWARLSKEGHEDSSSLTNRHLAKQLKPIGQNYELGGKIVKIDKLEAEFNKTIKYKLRKVQYKNVQETSFTGPTAQMLVNRVWRLTARTLHPDSQCFTPYIDMSMEDQFLVYRLWSDRESVCRIIAKQSDRLMMQMKLAPGSQDNIIQALNTLSRLHSVRPHQHTKRWSWVAQGQTAILTERCSDCGMGLSLCDGTKRYNMRRASKEINKTKKTLAELWKIQKSIYPPVKKQRENTKTDETEQKTSYSKKPTQRTKWKKARIAKYKRLLSLFEKPVRLMLKGEPSKQALKRMAQIAKGKVMRNKKKTKVCSQPESAGGRRLGNLHVTEKCLNNKYEKMMSEAREQERINSEKKAEMQREIDALLSTINNTSEEISIEAPGTCWNAIPLMFYDATNQQYWAETEYGKVTLPPNQGPITIKLFTKILEYYTSGKWSEKYGDLDHHFESDPEDKYYIKTNEGVWHLYRAGYNNYTDLVETDEDGHEIRMEEDDGTHTVAGLKEYSLATLADGLKEQKEELTRAKQAPVIEETDEPIKVGGNADCWKSIIGAKLEGDDASKTMTEFIEMVDMMVLCEIDFNYDALPEVAHERVALYVQDFGTHLHLVGGSIAKYDRMAGCRGAVNKWRTRATTTKSRTDNERCWYKRWSTNAWLNIAKMEGKPVDMSVPPESMSYQMFKEKYEGRKAGRVVPSAVGEPENDNDELLIGAIGTLNKLTSVNHALGAPIMPDTSKWEQLVDNHDLRAAALAIAKVDHQAYGLPGTKPDIALDELTNPEKGGWALGMNMTFTNKGSPAEAELAIPEATTIHMARQLMHGKKIAVYNCPSWLNPTEYIEVDRKGKQAVIFGTRDAITTANLAPVLTKKTAGTLLIPHYNKEMPAFITSDSGDDVFQRDTDNLHVVNACMTKVVSHDINLIHGLNTKDLVTIGNALWKITTMGTIGMYKVIHLSKMAVSQESFSHMVSMNYNTMVRKWSVFMPTTDTLLGAYIPTFQMREVTIDSELFRTMCAHNLHRGDLGFQAMMSRAIGFAHRRYHSKHGAIQRIDVSHESLVDHAFIATICVRRAYVQRRWLMNMDNEPAWVKAAIKYGATAGQVALQALHEGSGSFREFSDWIRHIQKVSVMNLHDYTNQNIFTEIESWSMEADTIGWQCHVAGQVYTTTGCGHHSEECTHTGSGLCKCCAEPTDDGLCSCCKAHSCQQSHKCHHKCNGVHSGLLTCDCCGKPSDYDTCEGCENPYEEYDEQLEWQEFEEKIASMGGSIPNNGRKTGPGHKPAGPAPTRELKPGTEYTTKDGVAAVTPIEDAVDLGSGKHLHKCAGCLNYYTHVHNFSSIKHPLFKGDCPWCEGNTKSIKTDQAGEPIGGAPPDEGKTEPRPIPQDKNRRTLLENGYSIEEIEAIGGNPEAYNKIIGLPTETTVTLPLIPNGITMMEASNTNFEPFGAIPDDSLCGVSTMKTWINRANLPDFIAVTNKEENHNTEDMCAMANYYKTNMVIISPEEIVIVKNQQKDIFSTIIADVPGHWRPGNAQIKVTKLGELTKTGAGAATIRGISTKIAKRVTDDSTVRLLTELEILHDVIQPNNMVTMVIEDDTVCNNKLRIHNPNKECYNYKLPVNFPSMARRLIENPTMTTYNEATSLLWEHDTHTNPREEIKFRIINAAINIAETHLLDKLKPGAYNVHRITLGTRVQGDVTFVTLPKGRWRPNDVVYMTSPEHSGWHVINPMVTTDAVGTQVSVAPMRLPRGGSIYEMRVAKGGYSSALKTLHCYTKLSSMMPETTTRVIESECIIGVPGSGKSRDIITKAGPTDMIVTFTNGNLQNMRLKLGDKFKMETPGEKMVPGKNTPRIIDILSALEMAASENPVKCSKLYIDECTMASLLEYEALKNLVADPENPENFKLYGDDSQIGQVTITKMRQQGKVTELQNFVNPDKIQHWDVSWRMGVEMCRVASIVTGRNITSKLGNHNRIVTYNLTDPAEQIRAIQRVNPRVVIICFTQATLRYLENRQIKGACFKVHGYQGQEADNIIVIQEKATTMNTIPADPRYCYSAFTRAKKDIHWISMGGQAGPIEQRIGKIGTLQGFVGNTFVSKLKQFLHLKKRSIEIQETDQDVLTYLSKFTKKDVGNGLSQISKTRISEYAKMKHGVNVMYKDNVDGSTDLQFYKGSMLGVECNYSAGKITVIKDKFNAMNQMNINAMEQAIAKSAKATVAEPVWLDCTQLGSQDVMLMGLLTSAVHNGMVMGINTRVYGNGHDWTVVGHEDDWSMMTISSEDKSITIKNTGQDDIIVGDSDISILHAFLADLWINKQKNLGIKTNAKATTLVVQTMGHIRGMKKTLQQTVSMLLGVEFNEDAENYKQYEEKFNQFNARNLLAYSMMTPHTIPDQPVVVGAKTRDDKLGWIIGNKFYPLDQRDTVESLLLLKSAESVTDSWVYKLAEMISSGIKSVMAKSMGSNLKSWIDHAAEDTHASQYISNKIAQLKARLLKFEQKPVTLTPSANKEWTTLIELTMSSCGYNWTSHPNVIDSNGAALEQVALRMLPETDDIKLYTMNADAVLLSGLYKGVVLQPQGEAAKAMYNISIPSLYGACERIINSNAEKLGDGQVKDNLMSLMKAAEEQKSGVDVWTGRFNNKLKHSNLVVNIAALDYSNATRMNNELFDMVKTNERITLITPKVDLHGTPHRRENRLSPNMVQIVNTTYGTFAHMTSELEAITKIGKATWQNQSYHGDIICSNNAIDIWEIKLGDRVELFSPINTTALNGLQKVEVPNITTNVMDMISRHEVIRKRVIYVDKRLYRSLALRAMREATTYEDLLVAARTQLHGVIYSPGSVVWKHITDSSILMDTAMVALWKGKRLLKNAGEAVRNMADSMSEDFVRSNLGRVKEMVLGLSGHVTKMLGLHLNWNQVAHILENSDIEEMRKVGMEMEKWAVRVDEYSREIIGVTKSTRPDTKVTSAITGFAVSNLLNVRSLVKSVSPTAHRELNPRKRKLIKKHLDNKQKLLNAILSHAEWWTKLDSIEKPINKILSSLNGGGSGTGKLATNPTLQTALAESIMKRDEAAIITILANSEGRTDADSKGTEEFVRRLQAYRSTTNEFNIGAADSITTQRLESLLTTTDHKLTKETATTLISLCKEPEDMEPRDYTTLWNAAEATLKRQGVEFHRTYTTTKNINNGRVCIVATGSRGDIRPAHNLAKQMCLDGARVSLVCPRGSVKESQIYDIEYVYGTYDVDEELKKWHKLMQWTPESIDIIMRDDLDNNWLRQLETDKLQTGYDLIVGSPVTPLGLCLAYIYNCNYVDFCPMPLRNVQGNILERVYSRLLSREYVLLHEKAIHALTNEMIGTKADMRALLLMHRPYCMAADSKLTNVQLGETDVASVGYWGGKTIDEKYDKIDFVGPETKTIVTMGSMMDQIAAERVLTDLDSTSTVVLAKPNSPLHLVALSKGIPTYSGDYNLSEVPDHLTIVHHGGAGTTAEATRSKAWQVVCPIAFDQKHWAKAIEERGLGRHIKEQKNLSMEDVRFKTPQRIDVKTDVGEMTSAFCKLLSSTTGAAWSWANSGSIFAKHDTGRGKSWTRLIGDRGSNKIDEEQLGVFYDSHPRDMVVEFDPMGTIPGESGTCAIRAINHVVKDNDGSIRLKLSKLRTTLEEVDNIGMSMESTAKYAMDCRLNVVICTERSCKAIISHTGWDFIYIWWQEAGHAVLIKPVELPKTRVPYSLTNNVPDEMERVTCSITGRNCAQWPNNIDDDKHEDICLTYEQTLDVIERTVNNVSSGQLAGTRAEKWNQHARRIIRDRVKSNFAVYRRKTHSWIRPANIKKWRHGLAIMEESMPGKLLAFHNQDGSYELGICCGRDEDMWSYYVTPKTSLDEAQPTGLILDSNTYLTGGSGMNATKVVLRALNPQTNTLLGLALPTCSNLSNKEAEQVVIGFHDGVPHHWNADLFKVYAPEEFRFTNEVVPNVELAKVLGKNEGPLKYAIYGNEVMVNLVLQLPGFVDKYNSQFRARWSDANDTFGVSWYDAKLSETVRDEIVNMTEPVGGTLGYYKLKLPPDLHNTYPASMIQQKMEDWNAHITTTDAISPSGPWHLEPSSVDFGDIEIGSVFYTCELDSREKDDGEREEIDASKPFWYTIDEENIKSTDSIPATSNRTQVVITRASGSTGKIETHLTSDQLWEKYKSEIMQLDEYGFIHCTSIDEMLSWMAADFLPLDAHHNVRCGPPRHENLSGWISRNGLVKYKDNLWTDWLTDADTNNIQCIVDNIAPKGYANLKEVGKLLGMTNDDIYEAINVTHCEVYLFKERGSTYRREAPFTADDDTLEGLNFYAEAAQHIFATNPNLTEDTSDDKYPVGDITYRKDEVNAYRNGNGNNMHGLTDLVKLDRTGQVDTTDQKWETICKVILDKFLKPNHNRILVTADAEWNPREQSEFKDKIDPQTTLFINLTMDCSYQQGWINCNIPAPPSNNRKALRQARTMFFYVPAFNPDVYVTVVGGREDFRTLSKGDRADYPKTKGVLKHNAHSIGGQLYMNNCTGFLGTLDFAKKYWKQDMELTSHIYGTDEWLASEVAANYTRMDRLTTGSVHRPQRCVAFVKQPPLSIAPKWLNKDEKEAAVKLSKHYGLDQTEDNHAIAMRILKHHRPGVVGEKVSYADAKLAVEDLSCCMEDKVVNGDGDVFTLTLEGLVRSTEDSFTSIRGVPPTDTQPLFIMPGCRMNNIAGYKTYKVNGPNDDPMTVKLNVTEPMLVSNVVHALAATSYQIAVVQWASDWVTSHENLIDVAIEKAPTIKPVYNGDRLVATIYTNPKPINFTMDKIKSTTPFECINHLAELRYTKDHQYTGVLKTSWPRTFCTAATRTGANSVKFHWSEIELNNLLGSSSKLQAIPIATVGEEPSGQNAGHLTAVSIINELTSSLTKLPEGPMRKKGMAEMELWNAIAPDSRWSRVNVDKNKSSKFITGTVITRSYKLGEELVIYHKARGSFLMQRKAKHMKYEQDDATIENDGLWFDTEEVQDTGLIETDKHGVMQGYKAIKGDTKTEGTKPEDQQEMMAWAVAIPEDEAEKIKTELGKEFIMHSELITRDERARLDQVEDIAMLNGILRAYSRRTPPGKILLTWGPKTVDQKQIIYRGSMMMSTNRYGEDNQHTRDALREGPDHERIVIVATEDEMVDKLKDTRKMMLEKRITEQTVLIQDLPLTEFLTNQLHDYELGASISTGNPNAKFSYMPLTHPGFTSIGEDMGDKGTREPVTDEIMAMYDNTDLTDLVRIQAPLNKGEGKGFIGTAMPVGVITSKKTALTEYPIASRPVLTQMAYSTENAVFNTLGSQITYRKHPLDPKHEVNMFIKTYGGPDTTHLMNKWAHEPLYFDVDRIQEWLAGRTGVAEIDRELQSILSEGLFNQPINKLNVHNKLESLLKSAPITSFSQQQVRIIVWQQKGYAALFSHVFLQAKARLKEFLGPKFLYADGLTPQQLSTRCRLEKCHGFLEDDLTKQDRQTDEDTINCEMRIYSHVLGVHQDIVQLWRSAHDHWFFKGSGIKGRLNMMRHTGQATTAIGNVLVNLLVHRRMADELGESLKLMLVLGDDNLTLADKPINARKLRVQIRDLWNMESKAEYSESSGVFLRMLACKDTNNRVQLGPDYVRLRNRFEFTNGQHMISNETIEARALSYACMLGPLPGVMSAISTCAAKVEPVEWYDPIPQIEAVGDYYFKDAPKELRAGMVHNEINLLNNMMAERKTFEYAFDHYTTVEKQRK